MWANFWQFSNWLEFFLLELMVPSGRPSSTDFATLVVSWRWCWLFKQFWNFLLIPHLWVVALTGQCKTFSAAPAARGRPETTRNACNAARLVAGGQTGRWRASGGRSCVRSRIGNTVRHSTPSSRDAREDLWYQPKELTRLKVVTKNR